eukprot:620457-Pelagomonas_calceolata.AAC.1
MEREVWREADALSPREDLDKGAMRNVRRFMLRAHHCLKVESCKWLDGSNVCDKCGCAGVQDEKH